MKVDRYGITALRDKLFTLNENKKSHVLISGLKTLVWQQPRQVGTLQEHVADTRPYLH
jgi:hypothetical protein